MIAVAGELDLCSAARLDQRLRRDHRPGTRLIVDLTRLEFMDCVGLRVLLNTGQRLAPGDFALTPGSRQVQMLLEMTEIKGLVGITSSVGPSASGR